MSTAIKMTVRAFYRTTAPATTNASPDCATLKVYYPALFTDTEEQRNSGFIPADSSHAPFPVAIIMPGINVGPEAYGWLAQSLAAQGIVTVTYSLVSEELPGMLSLSPGIDIEQLKPAHYRKAPSANALASIIGELEKIQESSVLQGLLALDKIILGGHSAGGTVALLNADQHWFEGLRGVFSYAAHTAAATALGWPADSYLETPSQLPSLLLGGECDGVIEGSQMRYGSSSAKSASAKLQETFEQAITSTRGDCYLAILAGANHFAITHPRDNTTGRAFLEQEQTRPAESIRQILAHCISLFITECCVKDNRQAMYDFLDTNAEAFTLLRYK